MEKFILILFLSLQISTFSQVSYDKTTVDMVNDYRKVNKKKPINWSYDLYEISKKQINRTDSVFRDGHKLILKHDMRLLTKLNIKEVLAYSSSDKNKRFNDRANPFIIHKLNKNDYKLFLSFIKKHFKKLYKEISVETKVVEDLGNGKYVVSNLKNGVYSYKGVGLYVDSIVGNKTYVRTHAKLIRDKIKLHVTNNLPDVTKDKIRIAYTIMQWHFSPSHKKIILSEGKEMSASNKINGDYLISVVNIR